MSMFYANRKRNQYQLILNAGCQLSYQKNTRKKIISGIVFPWGEKNPGGTVTGMVLCIKGRMQPSQVIRSPVLSYKNLHGLKCGTLCRRSILIGQGYHSLTRVERRSMVHLGALREDVAAEYRLKRGSHHPSLPCRLTKYYTGP